MLRIPSTTEAYCTKKTEKLTMFSIIVTIKNMYPYITEQKTFQI